MQDSCIYKNRKHLLHAAKSERFPELCGARNTSVERQQIDEGEAIADQRGGESAAKAAPAPRRTHVKAPQPQRGHGRVRLDSETTDGNERFGIESGQQHLAGFLEAFDAALPIPLQACDIQDTFGVGIRAQPREACRQGVGNTFEAECLAQIFTR